MIPRDHIVLHHTGAEEKDAAQVRRYHLSLGWRDVGYNYILERDGRVVEGRPPDIPGAHCSSGDMNRRGIGVALIGNLDNHPPTRRQVEVLPALLGKLMTAYEIPVKRVLGHREVPGAATVCPGRYVDMHALRKKLAGGGKGPLPESGVPVLREERVSITKDGRTTEDTTAAAPPRRPDALLIRSEVSPGYSPVSIAEELDSGKARALPEPIGPVLWRVLAGVYRTRRKAERRVRQLHEMGIDAVVVAD